MLKVSNYNLIVDCKSTNETIVYNTLYGSLVLFNSAEFEIVKQLFTSPNSSCNKNFQKILRNQKFLISDSIDEFSIIENRKRLGIKDKNRIDITIMPTLECNFSCVYCYENVKKGRMSDLTMESIKKWMTKEIPKYKLVRLCWYGGEPLLNFKKVVEITDHATKIASINDILLVKHITTNGYNFTDAIITKLIKLEIFDYQITIDGAPETHNKLRPLINGKGTFSRIFANIIKLLEADKRVKITLRINFNHLNLHEIPDLLGMFPEKCRNQLRISMEPIFGKCEFSATENILSDEISMSISKYYKIAEEFGYDTILGESYIETGKLVYCFAERENQVDINYNGDIFKCSVNDFDSSERIGYLDANGFFIKDAEKFEKWMNVPLFDTHCLSCKYVPLCMGGCRKSRVENKTTGSFCSLVPTNAIYVLKEIASKGFNNLNLSNQIDYF
jgi:uncharacterized protein